jgi:ApaG protein
MVGSYEAISDDGKVFSVDIPAFSLDIPGAQRVLN